MATLRFLLQTVLSGVSMLAKVGLIFLMLVSHAFAAEVLEQSSFTFYTLEQFKNSPPFSDEEIRQFHFEALRNTYSEEIVAARREIITAALTNNNKVFESGKSILGLLTSSNGNRKLTGAVMLLKNDTTPTIVQITAVDAKDYESLVKHVFLRFPSARDVQIVLRTQNPLIAVFEAKVERDEIKKVAVPSEASESSSDMVCYVLQKQVMLNLAHELPLILQNLKQQH